MDGLVNREPASPAANTATTAAAAAASPPLAQTRKASEDMETEQQQQQQPQPQPQHQHQHQHPQYHYGPTASQQPSRASPNGQNSMQSPSLLPPIHQGTLPAQPQYGTHPAAYVPAPPYAAYQNGGMQPMPVPPNVAPNGQNGMMRYPIPQVPVDSRTVTTGRHKKEIKRRTKTGCLTCRKRRIKCDEGQPTCKNCTKSKRDCLGYDPVFRQQTGHPALAAKPDAATSQPGTSPSPQSMKPVSMEDLFALDGVPPQFDRRERPASLSEDQQREVADFYMFHYAPGLDRVLETDWYTKHGLGYLKATPAIHDFTHQCTEQFRSRADEPHIDNQLRSLEARLIWQLASLPRANLTANPDLCTRVDTLENLLTGQFLDTTRIPISPKPGIDAQKYNEQLFWHNLGRFVAAHDDRPSGAAGDGPDPFKSITDSLAAMRGILGMLESRDVLYSIAIGRHVGGRMPDFHPARPLIATTNDPADEVNKLKVAHAFVEAEAQKGTTQVIQRVCGMALRGRSLLKE
ncbi:hypothetical protein KC347_g5842 [Hortaea werneckii]|nr:hypothetical protein KC347_g5842 [Hortaea werneckii]